MGGGKLDFFDLLVILFHQANPDYVEDYQECQSSVSIGKSTLLPLTKGFGYRPWFDFDWQACRQIKSSSLPNAILADEGLIVAFSDDGFRDYKY